MAYLQTSPFDLECIKQAAQSRKRDQMPTAARNWCGCPMRFLGYGQYPYDCEAKRRNPNAAIYRSDCEHSTSAWVPVGQGA